MRSIIIFLQVLVPPDTVGSAPVIDVLEVDTQTLPDDVYFLLVTAISTDDDSVQIRFPHMIDNTGKRARRF
jgi:hypothetical protein